MDFAQLTVGQLDVEFDQILVDLKPYIIKIQHQAGQLLPYILTLCQSFLVNFYTEH